MAAVLGDLADLYKGQIPKTGDLSGFASWDELAEFADTSMGSSYAPLVNLVEMRGGAVAGVIGVLRRSQSRPQDADVILSTAHKAKGAQWESVRLSSEFQTVWDTAVVTDRKTGLQSFVRPELEEITLQYVAATRAKGRLVHAGLIPKVTDHLKILNSASKRFSMSAEMPTRKSV